jgi:transcription-repair coupling factor (superfamily II helicase)
VPRFAEASNATEAFRRYVEERLAGEERVVLAAGTAVDLRFLGRVAERELGIRPERLADWDATLSAPARSVSTLIAELVGGFVHLEVTVVAFADLMGVRARHHAERRATEALPASEVILRLGDAVVHLDHGMGVLRGLQAVDAADVSSETIRLEYARKETLLVPIDEIGRIWWYATGASGVRLDGLHGEGWAKRRAQACCHAHHDV